MPLSSSFLLPKATPGALYYAIAILCCNSCGGEAYQTDEQGSPAATSDTLLIDDSLVEEPALGTSMQEEVGMGSIELPGPPPPDLRCGPFTGRWDELVIGGIVGIDWKEAFGPPSIVQGLESRWLEASGDPEAAFNGSLHLEFEREDGSSLELHGTNVTLGPATVHLENTRLRLHTQPAPFAIEGQINASTEGPLPISGRGWACTRALIP